MLACLAFVLIACQTDESLDSAHGKGHICLRLSADYALQTRAQQDVSDPSSWYAIVTDESSTLYDAQIGTALGAKEFEAGIYTISVRSHENVSASIAADGGWGAAYYEGAANDVEVSAGGTAYVHIACGRDHNTKLRLNYNEFSGALDALTITSPKAITFAYADGTLSREAFFLPNAVITYSITYTIAGETKTTAAQTLTLGGASTVSTLVIKSDIHGSLNISLTCDNEFEGDADADITINGTSGKS